MGYKINYEKNIEMQLKSEAIIQECLQTLDTAEEVLNKIKTTEAVKCKAKNALNAYMDDVIINRMIAATREAIQWYVWEQNCYIYEMYEHDDCETAIIEEEHLEDTKSALEEHYRYTEENIEGYRAVVDGISDIISLHAKTPDDMGNGYAGLKERVETTRDIYGEYQQRFAGRSQNLTEYIRKCYNLVTQCAYRDINMTEYEAAKTDLPGVETLEGERQKLIDDVGYTNEEIEKATRKKEEIVTAYIRRKEGEAKIRKLGGIIIGGLSLLCPMALSFTMPQMILSCSISGISVLYNTDQYLQGKQLLDAAETRNTNAEIDKIVDFKNETLNKGYEIIGTISTTYCGTLMMGTCIYKLGGGNVTFLSATADTGEDLLTDYLAGNIDEALGGGSPLRSLLISSLLSGGISATKGKITGGGKKQTLPVTDAPDVRKVVNIDAPDVRNAVKNTDALNVRKVVNEIDAADIKNAVKDIDAPEISSGKYSLYGEIAEGDGKAYERFLKDGPQEGLTEAEIIGIYKADKQAALNAISQNAVLGRCVEASYGKSSLNLLKNTENFMDSAIEHIFEGNVRRGKAGGYHYECVEGTAGNIVSGTEVSVNDFGVYKAQVEVNGIPKLGNGGYSTFFSKKMSPQEIIDAINEAYSNKIFKVGSRNTYIGTLKNGMEIEMYIKDGKIISAFPKE